MSFLVEYLQHAWSSTAKEYDAKDLQAWTNFLDAAEKDRQREWVATRISRCCCQARMQRWPCGASSALVHVVGAAAVASSPGGIVCTKMTTP